MCALYGIPYRLHKWYIESFFGMYDVDLHLHHTSYILHNWYIESFTNYDVDVDLHHNTV